MCHKPTPSAFFLCLLIVLGITPGRASAQIYDVFDDGDDVGWTRSDPLGAISIGPPANFTFPDGGYRLVAPAPQAIDAGQARVVSFRADTIAYTDTFVAVDLVDWDNTLDQGFGLAVHLNDVGLGTTTGYIIMCYINPSTSQPYGEFEIDRITNEAADQFIVTENIKMNPDRSYRITASFIGPTLKASLYDLEDLTTPLSEIIADNLDLYPSGAAGLVAFHRGTDTEAWTQSESHADITFDNFVAQESLPLRVSAPATPHGIAGAPQVVDRSPTSNANFHPAQNGLTFRATTLTDSEIDSAATQVLLNGRDVSGELEIIGEANNRSIAYRGLKPNQVYRAEIQLATPEGITTRNIFTFDTFEPKKFQDDGFLVIEAEDYNFGEPICDFINGTFPVAGGKFLELPDLTNVDFSGFVIPFGAAGYADTVGMPDVDYSDFSSFLDLGNDDSFYRYCDAVGVRFSLDTRREAYVAANLEEQEVYRTETGEWWNFTRGFSPGKQNVYLRVASRAEQVLSLDRITGDPTSLNQNLTKLGQFNIPSTVSLKRHMYVPLSDGEGNLIEVDLEGRNTLRLTVDGPLQEFTKKWTLATNYLLFVPASSPPVIPENFDLVDPTIADETFSFSFSTQEGLSYFPEFKNSLNAPKWTPLPAIMGSGEDATVNDPVRGTHRIFRVRIE
ncbi:MAG TPA: hypothetical protein EYQ50_20125 [Verrucomicrobiales bacterium]|nr:hypothetical protein [Verrucomicrobiales bacterium]